MILFDISVTAEALNGLVQTTYVPERALFTVNRIISPLTEKGTLLAELASTFLRKILVTIRQQTHFRYRSRMFRVEVVD